jgi:hypothetical protein
MQQTYCAVHIIAYPMHLWGNDLFLHANFALAADLFALAQKVFKGQNDPAFQASSPKTFKAGPKGPALFLCLEQAWPRSLNLSGALDRVQTNPIWCPQGAR